MIWWFAKRKRCYREGTHGPHRWTITRMGEVARFKCPGDDGEPSYAW